MDYSMLEGSLESYRVNNDGKITVDMALLTQHIQQGDGSPWILGTPVALEWLLDKINYLDLLTDPASGVTGSAKRRVDTWERAAVAATKYARVYEEVYNP